MMKSQTLINKTVRIKDVGVIGFLYPSFITFRDNNYDNHKMQLKNVYFKNIPLIYKGENRKIINKILEDPSRKIIIAVPPKTSSFDIDFTERYQLLSFIYDKWGQKYKQKTRIKKEQLEDMNYEKFLCFVKTYWVTGKEPFKLINKAQKTKIDLLFEYINKNNVNKSFKTLLQLFEQGVNSYYIEKKMLEYIESQLSSIDNNDKSLIISRYRSSRELFKDMDHELNIMFLLSMLLI